MAHPPCTSWVTVLGIGAFASASAFAQGAAPSDPDGSHELVGAPSTPPPLPRAGLYASRTTGAADALLPGFETLADGSTRLFVELSRPVHFDTKFAPGSVTYVLKGARVDRRNNYNPLVTVHFNTPVTSARLVAHGHDLWFVVALRAAIKPSVVVDPGKNGGSMLRIEFAKGQYLPVAPPASTPASGPAPGAADSSAR